MNLLFPLSSENMKYTYDLIRSHLKQDHTLIFQAMHMFDNKFDIPDESELAQNRKHEEIKRRFDFRGFNGIEVFMKLIPLIYKKLEEKEYYKESELEIFLHKTVTKIENSDVKLTLTKNCIWVAIWPTKVSTAFGPENLDIPIFLYDAQLNEIVPKYIVELLSSAISAYMQKLHMPSIILTSIALEATLRKALYLRGYSPCMRGASNDDYKFISGQIALLSDQSGYMLHFDEEPAKSPREYYSLEQDRSVPIRIKRKIRDKGKYDLIIRGFDEFTDYLSSNNIATPRKKTISGLGNALSISRYDERILTDIDLPTDMDEILKGVRNNLIHVSEDSFSASIDNRTLGEVLENQLAVYDLISNVSNYINKQYLDIYKQI